MKNKFAALIAATFVATSASAGGFENQVFANDNVKAMELSQTEMKETQGEFLPLVILGGAAIGAWVEHGISKYKHGTWASPTQVVRGAAIGAIPGGVGWGAKVAAPTVGTVKHWVRVGNSYSHTQKAKTVSVRWGSNNHYAQQIGNQTVRKINTSFRQTRLPGSNWRVQDKGHFHLWKR